MSSLVQHDSSSGSLEVRDLTGIALEALVECITAAFQGYFVTLPTEVEYWAERFRCARVHWHLSFGVFDTAATAAASAAGVAAGAETDRLVAFIITGVDHDRGNFEEVVAFNCGTGVLPEYRGKRLVDQLYAHALPLFRLRGVTKCALEVIRDNARALRVYERLRFRVSRIYLCFKGTLNPSLAPPPPAGASIAVAEINRPQNANEYDSWDNCDNAIARASPDTYKCFQVKLTTNIAQEQQPDQQAVVIIGFFIIKPSTGYVAQLELADSSRQAEHWPLLLDGIMRVSTTVSINNVDSKRRAALVKQLLARGLQNHVSQF
jgi:ribosomal protein S18 acetylase RimI-like enzyme